MTGKRKRYSGEFKAKVLEAIRGDLTIAQLVAKHGVHQTVINDWKKQAVKSMAQVFSGTVEAAGTARAEAVDRLHARIGQLVVERDFDRRPSVNDHGSKAADDRARSPATVDREAMQVGPGEPVGVL